MLWCLSCQPGTTLWYCFSTLTCKTMSLTVSSFQCDETPLNQWSVTIPQFLRKTCRRYYNCRQQFRAKIGSKIGIGHTSQVHNFLATITAVLPEKPFGLLHSRIKMSANYWMKQDLPLKHCDLRPWPCRLNAARILESLHFLPIFHKLRHFCLWWKTKCWIVH